MRTTAIEALYFVAKPEFNPVIKPILKAATNDKDAQVSKTAKKLLQTLTKKDKMFKNKMFSKIKLVKSSKVK
ncbi:MAG: hypothetical protein L6V95_13850 [Candidatus Melainabacteria bacterium]|nr:MAG: hypothetical protein L6V95_13850 [Candidatus Melainabacteria bacterium]